MLWLTTTAAPEAQRHPNMRSVDCLLSALVVDREFVCLFWKMRRQGSLFRVVNRCLSSGKSVSSRNAKLGNKFNGVVRCDVSGPLFLISNVSF